MKARYQYRFYPTDEQWQRFAQLFGCVGVVWNDAVFLGKSSEKLRGYARLSGLSIASKKTEQRKSLHDLFSVRLEQSLRHLAAAACKNVFAPDRGFRKGSQAETPRLKTQTNDRYAEFIKAAFSIEAGQVYPAKIGTLTPILFGELPPEISSVTAIKDGTARYFLSFVLQFELRDARAIDRESGSDLGCKIFAALSNLSASAASIEMLPTRTLGEKQTNSGVALGSENHHTDKVVVRSQLVAFLKP